MKALTDVTAKNEDLQAQVTNLSKLLGEGEVKWSSKYNELIKEKVGRSADI